jgi:nucleoid DNA-binding protein
MINDLKDGKEVKIYNFGTFSLKEDPIKKYYNIFFKKVMESRLHKTMRFKLANSIHKKLLLLLDPDKISNAKEGSDE